MRGGRLRLLASSITSHCGEPTPRESIAVEGSARRGRWIVAAVLSIQVLLPLVLIALTGGRSEARQRVVFLLCEGYLMYQLWRGHRWARLSYAGVCVLGAMLAAGTVIGGTRGWPALMVVALGAWFAVVAILLLFSPSVRAFCNQQRTGRGTPGFSVAPSRTGQADPPMQDDTDRRHSQSFVELRAETRGAMSDSSPNSACQPVILRS